MKHFKAYELVPEIVYKQFGDLSEYFIDSKLRETLDKIRIFINMPIIVNNWINGGEFSNRGFRTADSNIGAKLSMHKVGGAIDCHCPHLSADELREIVIKNQSRFKHIKRIEADVNWLHMDIKETGLNYIYLFKSGE